MNVSKIKTLVTVLLPVLLIAAAGNAHAAGGDQITVLLSTGYDYLFHKWGPFVAAIALAIGFGRAWDGRVEWGTLGWCFAGVAGFFSVAWILEFIGVIVPA